MNIAPFKQGIQSAERRGKTGRKKGNERENVDNKLHWEQVGFDILFGRVYDGNASSHSREFVQEVSMVRG